MSNPRHFGFAARIYNRICRTTNRPQCRQIMGCQNPLFWSKQPFSSKMTCSIPSSNSLYVTNLCCKKSLCTSTDETSLSELEFEQLCEDTLDSLAERLEDMDEEDFTSDDYDVNFASGVITVTLGGNLGTYVINKQSPNMQIWLSSPTSGPRRFDYVNGHWIYKRDGVSLHQLLSEEMSRSLQTDIDFTGCVYGRPNG